MTRDDALFRYRLRGFALAHELGNIRAACRAPGIHHSTYYRWLRQVQRFGLEVLRPRERKAPRMPNAISVLLGRLTVMGGRLDNHRCIERSHTLSGLPDGPFNQQALGRTACEGLRRSACHPRISRVQLTGSPIPKISSLPGRAWPGVAISS